MAVSIAAALLALTWTVAAAQVDFLGAPCVGSVCDNGMECLSLAGGKCDWDGYSLGPSCTCGGVGGELDPYFTGFSGQSFYFEAEAENIYNIFSEQTHLINARFVATELPEESDLLGLVTGSQNSSFIGAVAMQHNTVTVEVVSDKNAQITVFANGKEVDMGDGMIDVEPFLKLDENVMIYFEKDPLTAGTTVKIETELVELIIVPESVHMDNMGNTVRGHLSLELNLNCGKEDVDAHGILGQTIYPDVTTDIVDAFPGDGNASDYIVSSMFATDYRFNHYGQAPRQTRSPDMASLHGAHEPLQLPSSRRLLTNTNQQAQKPTKLVAAYFLKPAWQ